MEYTIKPRPQPKWESGPEVDYKSLTARYRMALEAITKMGASGPVHEVAKAALETANAK